MTNNLAPWRSALVGTSIVLLAWIWPQPAESTEPLQVLWPTQQVNGQSFGRGVAISAAVTVAGSPGDDEFRPGVGSARIFGGLNLLFADGFEGGDTDDWSP